jgi:hypothetical protein
VASIPGTTKEWGRGGSLAALAIQVLLAVPVNGRNHWPNAGHEICPQSGLASVEQVFGFAPALFG